MKFARYTPELAEAVGSAVCTKVCAPASQRPERLAALDRTWTLCAAWNTLRWTGAGAWPTPAEAAAPTALTAEAAAPAALTAEAAAPAALTAEAAAPSARAALQRSSWHYHRRGS